MNTNLLTICRPSLTYDPHLNTTMPQSTGVARLRLSPGEVQRLLKEETERRRRLRIVQVRNAACRASKNRLEAVRKEKVRQLEKLVERIQEEWEAERQAKIEELEMQYADSLKCIGSAHSQADEFDLGLEQKAIAVQEYSRKAEERYTAAVTKLREEKHLQEAETEATRQARQLALAKEKLRAKEVASIPPPIRPELRNLLKKAKAACVQLTDADTYTYPYQLPTDQLLVEKNENSLLDGLVGAEEENVKRDDYQRTSRCNDSERLEKARVRGMHALKRERIRQDQNNMMTELELLVKADRKQRQQNLEHIPQSLYLPAHVVAEREADKQVEMERKVEDIFADELDNVELRANAPALNYDTTPTMTETTGESPADLQPQPPITRVKDKGSEAGRSRVPLQNVTNVTSDSTESTESGSERKRRVVLKKIMRRIENQKQQWVQEELEAEPSEGLPSPPRCLPSEQGASEEISHKVRATEEISNETLSQAPDTSNGETTNEELSQVKMSSESNTTSSSQFIERQRQELVEYMKSLEQQIGQLQTLQKDKEVIEEDESLTRRLERKLTNQHLVSVSTDNSGSTEVSSGETLEQTQLTQSVETQTPASLHVSSPPVEEIERRPDESVWEWFLRRKAPLNASIRHKLDLITSSRDKRLTEETTPTQHDYFVQPDYQGSEVETIPQPPGYVPVQDRESLTQMSLPGTCQEAGYSLHDMSGAGGDKSIIASDYLSVAERERLMRPFTESAHESIGYEGQKEPDQLEEDLLEHSQRLGRLQQLISATRLEQLGHSQHTQSEARSLQTDQSSLRVAELDQSGQRSTLRNQSAIRASQPDQSLLRSALLNQSVVKSAPMDQLAFRSSSMDQPAVRSTPMDQSDVRSTPMDQSAVRYTPMDQSAVTSTPMDQSAVTSTPMDQSAVRFPQQANPTIHPETRPDQSVPPTGAVATPSYMTVDERERLLRPANSLPVENSLRPTWQEVLRNSQAPPATQPHPVESESEGTQATGWSLLHHQMMARHREYNRRQEELRKQLADIQEQKRKLLAPSSVEELRDTQEELRSRLESLGIDVDEEATPYERRERPPVTTKPGLTDLDLHELSVIQEVDTPTHFTSYDDTLPDYRSLARGDSHTLTPTTGSNESRPPLPPITDELTVGPITDRHDNINQNAREVETSSPRSEGAALVDSKESSPSDQSEEAAVSADSQRIHMLNELLQQLEARRVERQSFLEREKLTALSDEASGRNASADNVEHSPRIIDMYSSSSADEAAAVHPGSDSSSRSIPSGDTLSAQLHDINVAWEQQPVSVPFHVSQGFTSSDSSTPSSGLLRRLHSQHSDEKTDSKGSSPAHDLEQLLQTVSSDGQEVTEPFVTVSLGAESSLLGAEATSRSEGGSAGSLSQCSLSVPSSGEELTQATDHSLVPNLGRVGPPPNVFSDSDDTPMNTVAADTDADSNSPESMDMQPSALSSTPMKVVISDRTDRLHQAHEEFSGPMDEPEITFASTIADSTLMEGDDVQRTATASPQLAAVGLEWVDETHHTDEGTSEPPPDVRPKTTHKTLDSAARKKKQSEMTSRTKRLYSQLEEVKQKQAYKEREERKTDVQARRKEYGSKLLSRAKKSNKS